MESKLAIEVQGLCKSFGEGRVLDGVDLSVPEGTIFGYLGPNGAGKSTTVKILMGMLGGFSGSARVLGVDVAENPIEVRRSVGYVPENAELYEVLTVAEHLELVGQLFELDLATARRRGQALAEAFDLGPRLDSRLATLSKGMRQKVLFCGALLHRPRLLFLDEPLSGLDVASTVMIKELLELLSGSGVSVLYCSHVMDVVERVCDSIAILSGGKVIASGTFEELQRMSGEAHLERIFSMLTGAADGRARAERVLDALS